MQETESEDEADEDEVHVPHDSEQEDDAGFISANYIAPFVELCRLGRLDGQAGGWVQLTDLEAKLYKDARAKVDTMPKNERRCSALFAYYELRGMGLQHTHANAIAATLCGVAERTLRDWHEKAELRSEIPADGRTLEKERRRWVLRLLPGGSKPFEEKITDWVDRHEGQTGTPNATVPQICQFINQEILGPHKDVEGVHDISEPTCRRWLHALGYQYEHHARRKGFADGHEREDNVAARSVYIKKIGAVHDDNRRAKDLNPVIEERIAALVSEQERTASANADAQHQAAETLTSGEEASGKRDADIAALRKELAPTRILIYTDECIYHANDKQEAQWRRENMDHQPLRKKSEGAGLMVLLFLTEYGEVQLDEAGTAELKDKYGLTDHDGTSRLLLKIGKNREGYMDSALYLNRVENMLRIFTLLYPGQIPVLVVDQSGVHLRWGENAIRATKINLNDDTEKQLAARLAKYAELGEPLPQLRGWYMNGDQRIEQPFYYPDGRRKGGLTILAERGITKPPSGKRRWYVEEVRNVLQQQSDFAKEGCELQHLVEKYGGELIISPKYHPEFNPCELAWAVCKNFTRAYCTNSIAGLEKLVHMTFPMLQQDLLCKLFDHCEAWRLAYLGGASNGTEAKFVVNTTRKQRRTAREHAKIDEATSTRSPPARPIIDLDDLLEWAEVNVAPLGSEEVAVDTESAVGSTIEPLPYVALTSHRQVYLPTDILTGSDLARTLRGEAAAVAAQYKA